MEEGQSCNPFLDDDYGDEVLVDDENVESELPDDRLGSRISYEVIARQLVTDRFVLTALELHTELQEIGKPLIYLRDYFSNPGNFERTRPSDLQSTSPPVGLRKCFTQMYIAILQ